MENRIDLQKLEPAAYRAMYGLVKYMEQSSLTKAHIHLVNVRASQVNGCAYCINMHTQEALADGETQQRLFLLDAWRESDRFSPQEQVVLALTEEVTRIGDQGLTAETYEKAGKVFEPNYIAQLIMAVVTINAWNRMAISTHKRPD